MATRQCSSCNAGLYAVFENVSAGVFRECRFCPEGASCAALSNMTISPRYFAVRDPTTLAVQTYLCGGDRCAANGACGPNRVAAADNPLCGQCLPGHSEWDGSCLACSGVNGALVFGLLVLAWACMLVIHAFAQRSSTSSSLRIAMFFWQVSFLIVGGAVWARWAAFLELNFLAIGSSSGALCPFPVSPHGSLVLQLMGPLLSYALLAVTAGLHGGLRQLLPRTRAWLPPLEPAAYGRTCIALYFFTFNSVTRACLDFFNCATLPSGRYMVALPAVRCDEDAHRALTPLAVLLLAAYAVVVPGFTGHRLRQAQQRRAPESRVWSVVLGPLRAEAFWWSMAQMLARAALVAAAVYLRADDRARFAVFALLSAASALLTSQLQPNRDASDNSWELAAHSALAVLAQSENMEAPEAWPAVLTLGFGAALAFRLGVQSLRRLVSGGPGSRAGVDGADHADHEALGAPHARSPSDHGLSLAGASYVALNDDALS
jgi:hypothetical protein